MADEHSPRSSRSVAYRISRDRFVQKETKGVQGQIQKKIVINLCRYCDMYRLEMGVFESSNLLFLYLTGIF